MTALDDAFQAVTHAQARLAQFRAELDAHGDTEMSCKLMFLNLHATKFAADVAELHAMVEATKRAHEPPLEAAVTPASAPSPPASCEPDPWSEPESEPEPGVRPRLGISPAAPRPGAEELLVDFVGAAADAPGEPFADPFADELITPTTTTPESEQPPHAGARAGHPDGPEVEKPRDVLFPFPVYAAPHGDLLDPLDPLDPLANGVCHGAGEDVLAPPLPPRPPPHAAQVDLALREWAEDSGKPRPIRVLLTTLHQVLPPALGFGPHAHFDKWTPLSLGDVLQPGQVKNVVQQRARKLVAPDKVPRALPKDQVEVCTFLFRTVNSAYSVFREAEL